MGMMLVVFMPVGLIMLAYLMIKTIHSMFREPPQMMVQKFSVNKKNYLTDDEAEKAR